MSVFSYASLFPQQVMDEIFPADRADQFFEALFGDVSEGAYDIVLAFTGETESQIHFEFQLIRRPGRCLACNLTYGLPDVFSRHPIIDVAGVVGQIGLRMTNGRHCTRWTLGRTREVSSDRHVIPLTVNLASVASTDDP